MTNMEKSSNEQEERIIEIEIERLRPFKEHVQSALQRVEKYMEERQSNVENSLNSEEKVGKIKEDKSEKNLNIQMKN